MQKTDVISLAVEYLNKKLHTNIDTQYYANIRTWRYWWEGFVKEVHTYRELGVDNKARQRELYKLKMAKRVCEDWASLLLNEKTELVLEHKASAEYLHGKDGLGGVLAYNNFWSEGNELIEKAFAMGTGAFVARAEGARISDNGSVIPNADCKVGIEYVEALNIIPLSVKKSKITECAFVSEFTDKGKSYCYLETHTLDENGNYIIENEYFKIDGSLQKRELPQGIAPLINTNSDIPWFAIFYPNVANNIRHNNGMGMSVFADAIDSLIGVDLAFNNFLKDFKLGGKKVFYDKSMLQTNAKGDTITPDDVAQQLFQMIGDGEDFEAKGALQEFNPSLRVAENKDGIQFNLDLLSFKCGMGTKRYRFESGGVKTATEYTGEKQDLVQHANKHMIPLESALKSLCKAILYIGKEFCNADCDYETSITVKFEDGFIIDNEAQREKDRQDVRDGIMTKWEYRVKWYGETKEEAEAVINGMMTASENPFGFMA